MIFRGTSLPAWDLPPSGLFERPDSGSIALRGKKLASGSPSETVRSGIGYIPIDRRSEGLALGMTVAENVNLLVLDRCKVAGLISPVRERSNAMRS
jgi:ribose transport system ATP-binding protein